jgi:RNA polymerase sigma-70 factor (ECF subfamily)
MVALNRTYALSKANGKKEAIVEAEKIDMKDNHLYFSLLGNLYTEFDPPKAIKNFEKALSLASTKADQVTITKNLLALKQK